MRSMVCLLVVSALIFTVRTEENDGWLRRTRCYGDNFPALCQRHEYVHVNDVIMGKSSCDDKCCPLPLIDDCAALANATKTPAIYEDVRSACASSRTCGSLALYLYSCHEKSGAFQSHKVDYISITYVCKESPSTLPPKTTTESSSPISSKTWTTIATVIGVIVVVIVGIVCAYFWCRKKLNQLKSESEPRIEVNHLNVTMAAPPGVHHGYPGHGYPPPYEHNHK